MFQEIVKKFESGAKWSIKKLVANQLFDSDWMPEMVGPQLYNLVEQPFTHRLMLDLMDNMFNNPGFIADVTKLTT